MKMNEIMELIKNFSVPTWVKNNVITALGKGINGIISEASEIPQTKLRNYNERLKLIGEINRELIKKASQNQLNQIEIDPELANRALKNYGVRMYEEQLNKENVIELTLENLETIELNENLTEKEISNDWLTTFWNIVGGRSEDEIQKVLSKILSEEIINPGNISIHTLQTLSILDSKVGKIFTRFCNLSIDDGQTAYVIHPNVFAFQNIGPLDDYNISFNDLLYLDGANLIRSTEALRINFGDTENQEDKYELINYAGKKAKINVSGSQLCLIYFTQSGKELRGLISVEEDLNYTERLKTLLKNNFILIE
jgi:Protein of unknown function (DUF2806)